MILDIGCGYNPHGDVNVDLHPEASAHRNPDQRNLAPALDVKRIPNFIHADGQYLPFRDGAFSLVYSAHAIEHVANAILMLREMLRVGRREVVIICPHRYAGTQSSKPLHRHFLNKKWFERILASLGEVRFFDIAYSDWRYFPHGLIPLVRLPAEMHVTIMKFSQGVFP